MIVFVEESVHFFYFARTSGNFVDMLTAIEYIYKHFAQIIGIVDFVVCGIQGKVQKAQTVLPISLRPGPQRVFVFVLDASSPNGYYL